MPSNKEIEVSADALKKYIGKRLMAGFGYAGKITDEVIEREMGTRSVLAAKRMLEAAEKVREEYVLPAPDVDESEQIERFNVLRLEALVRLKLTSFRDRDRMHLRDMLDVELLDQSWYSRFPAELAARLQELIDTPDG